MKAIFSEKYGPPEALKLQEVPKPVPKENQVLIKIHAASLNAADWHLMRGRPFLMRLVFGGIFNPKFKILGADIAGTVDTVGSNIKRFKPGDEVFGDISSSGWGAFAEFAAVKEDTLVLKPTRLSFEEAAAIPLASVTALQALRDTGKIKAGQEVLINGSSGGVGTFAIQIAKNFGANVTAVCSTTKVELARSLGADKVIDYKSEDFTQSGQLYDLILDIAAFRPLSDHKRILKPGGAYVLVGGAAGQAMRVMAFGAIMSMTGNKKISGMMAKPNSGDLTIIKDLIEKGKISPVIDRKYPFQELPEAMRYLEEGHARGKIIVSIV